MAPAPSWLEIEREALTLFQDLLRLDTTNSPGNELPAAELLAKSLRADGLDPWIGESAPGRANLVVRLEATDPDPGAGPLLLAGHTDVVPARAEQWTHPPFAAHIADEMLWGRGAIDMKNMVAMSAMAIKLAARHLPHRRRDLIFAAVADEEEGCDLGSSWLVEHHPERVRAEYMLGEVGGFWLNFAGTTYIPVMIAEKGRAHLRLHARGEPGHASIPRKDNALARLNRAAYRISETPLPYTLTPAVEQFIRGLAQAQGVPNKLGLRGLLKASTAPLVLDRLLPDRDQARAFRAMLHNTASVTMMQAGTKLNTIADQATCEIDARTLPGCSVDTLVAQLREVIDDDQVEIEVVSHWEATALEQAASPVYDAILGALRAHAPQAHCVPYMVTGFTDAKAFSKLGTKCYGFSPVKMEPRHGLSFSKLFHGVDERIPVKGFHWGTKVLWDVVSELVV